jgi:hypothetical protein
MGLMSNGRQLDRASDDVAEEIRQATDFANRIEKLVLARGQAPTGDRNTLLMAYWSLVFELQKGVLCLMQYKFYGAAFALVRPIIETVVRAHVAVMGSADDLRKLHSDEYRTNLATVGQEIDAAFGTEGFFENFLNGARTALHSYTHAGLMQLGRRFSGTDLVANYREAEIVEVIRTCTSSVFMVNNLVTKHLGFEAEWKQNTDLFAEWGNNTPEGQRGSALAAQEPQSGCFGNLAGCNCRLVYERLRQQKRDK